MSDNSNLFDEEFKEQAKETVDEGWKAAMNNKRLLAEVGVFSVLTILFSKKLKKTKLTTEKASFEMGKLAGRAEYAEELAEKAIMSGIRNN